MSDPVRTATELNPGVGGSKMDEVLVDRPDGVQVHRTLTVPSAPTGEIYTDANPQPVGDRGARAAAERQYLFGLSKLDVNLQTRHRERMRWGDRLDLIDRRGPGGR